MTLLKKLNFKLIIFSVLTLLIVVVAAYSTINNSQKANALNSSLTTLTDTIQYQKFYTITTPSSAPGGLNYIYYELPIRSSGTVLDPNTYLEVAAIKSETLQESTPGSGIFNVTNTIDYTASDITKAQSTTTISGNPGLVVRFSPGLPCDTTGTATSCLTYTDPNTVPASARTFTASPQSRARVTVTLKLKDTAPTSTNGLFITEANWVTPGGFPSDRITSVDQWNVALNYTAQSASSSSVDSSVVSSSVTSSVVSSVTSSVVSSSVASSASSVGISSISSSSRPSSTSSSAISVPRSTPSVSQLPITGGFSVALALISGLGAVGSFSYLSRRKGIKDVTGDVSVKSNKPKINKK
jgi:hypothetical protein